MESQKGKGLSGISLAMIAIVWFEIKLHEISFLGVKFQSDDEAKFMTAWIVIWGFFVFRYLQRWNDLKEEFRLNFSRKIENQYQKSLTWEEKQEGRVLPDEVSQWSSVGLLYQTQYAVRYRDYLDYTLQIILAVFWLMAFGLKVFLFFAFIKKWFNSVIFDQQLNSVRGLEP